MVQCAAKSKRSGEQCRRQAMHGSHLCYMHGGKTPRGHALPQTTHGRYSKDLPTRMASRYAEALADTELLSLRDDVAVVDARIAELLARIDAGESGRIWAQLIQAKSDLLKATEETERRLALAEILRLIDKGNADWMVVEDIVHLQDHKRKLGESERKRLIEMRQIITAEQAAVLLGAITDVIVRNVTDRDTRARISAELTRIADTSPR